MTLLEALDFALQTFMMFPEQKKILFNLRHTKVKHSLARLRKKE